MTRINTGLLIIQATDVVDRANFVRKDPAVIKAAKEARADFARAGLSTSRLFKETGSAWRRSNDRSRREASAR